MEFGWYVEFHRQVAGQSDTDAFAQGLAQVQAAEDWGLDAIWLAEIHQQPGRSVMSVPMTLAAAIAGRTNRIKIGTAVQVLPLCHPLRLAEELATVDQISRGRLLFGAGRSGNPRAYAAYGVPYSESRERFYETLDILKLAWTQPSFSYEGKYHSFNDARAVPRPFQQPHPPIRIAGASEDTFPGTGQARLSVVRRRAQRVAGGAGAGPEGVSRGVYGGGPFRQGRGVPARDAARGRDRHGGARAGRT